MNLMRFDDKKMAVIGLGYVGLPLAAEFGNIRPVIGFDINQKRTTQLSQGIDETLELSTEKLKSAKFLSFSSDIEDLKSCGIFIVAVPTPIDSAKRPDLKPLKMASKLIGEVMPENAVIIYESTVYPGCTREVCVPILEETSGFKFNKTFFVGYSPERINPGDKVHRLTNIVKVTSGSDEATAENVDKLYASIITAGTHKASSIEVAEASKVIENTQRDLNIALMNELAVIFNRLNIDTDEVLQAAGSKWNFLPFKPGLVGGHCIGVDPYYLTHKAQQIGYHPEVILAGRRINDTMGEYVCDQVIKLMLKNGSCVVDSKILILGLAFKENCPDLRNTRVVDIINSLKDYNTNVDVWDPWVSPEDALSIYNISSLQKAPSESDYDAIIIAVGHHQFKDMGVKKIRQLGKPNAILYDVKSMFERDEVDARL